METLLTICKKKRSCGYRKALQPSFFVSQEYTLVKKDLFLHFLSAFQSKPGFGLFHKRTG
jgi:hypothetical protein